MDNYFYVDIDDEITSVIGKLRKKKAEEVFLVVPKRALIAQSLVNLQLLEKETKKFGKKLIFVSPDVHTRKIAEKAGLMVKKYFAKPKEENKGEAYGSSPKKQPSMQPWEEAAAKEELAKVIGGKKVTGSQKPVVPNSEVTAQTSSRTAFSPPLNKSITVKARVFANGDKNLKSPANIPAVSVKPPPAKPQVVDLKKIAAEKREERIASEDKRGKILKPSDEPSLKELLKSPAEGRQKTISNDTGPKPNEPKIKMHLAKTNPFKVRPLNGGSKNLNIRSEIKSKIENQEKAIIPEPELQNTNKLSSDQGLGDDSRLQIGKNNLDLPKNSVSVEKLVEPETGTKTQVFPKVMTADKRFKEFERETTSLTIKEKERLKDLWMEQKKIVRGKTFQSNTVLDLKSFPGPAAKEEKVEDSKEGIFQTTHRRVIGSLKVVDLRNSPTALFTVPRFTEERRQKKNGREIILPLFNVKLFFLFVLGILAVLAVIVGVIIPEASVSVKPRVAEEDLEFKNWINGEMSEIDLGQRQIPGKPIRFKLNEENTFSATTEKEIKENSQGQIVLYNQSQRPLSLKQNALLTDKSGKKFYTTAPVTIPAAEPGSPDSNINGNTNSSTSLAAKAGTAVVAVSSEGTGKDYNLKEGVSLEMPGLKDGDYSGLVTVTVKKEITGGESKVVKTISREDLDRAKEELLVQAKQDSLGEIQKNPEAKNVKLDNLFVEDMSFSSSKTEGEQSDSFNANITVTFFTVSFSQDDLVKLAKDFIEGQKEEKDGTVKIIDFRMIDAKPLENKMEISTNLVYQLSDAIDEGDIRKSLVAKKKQEAEDYLAGRSDVEKFTLNVWPNLLGYMPVLERRIKIEIQ